MTLTFGSLFAGVGGFDLGFERAGLRCVWQVEIDDYARRVLAKHWSNVRRWDDVRTFPPEPAEEWRADVICGGFPCQDVSLAGKRAGIDGPRSGLWSEFARTIRILRPRFVVVENVPGLFVSGMGRVLGDLAACGYDAEWDCIPAAAFGHNHVRDRCFIYAYPNDRSVLSYPASVGLNGRLFCTPNACSLRDDTRRNARKPKPNIPRVANGVPNQLDRCRVIGNAVSPDVAEWIGRRIIEAVEEPTP